jgi:hypothetical protein
MHDWQESQNSDIGCDIVSASWMLTPILGLRRHMMGMWFRMHA